VAKISYGEYYAAKNALEDLLPSKRDITNELVPQLVVDKAHELRLMILGQLAELNEQGWDDDE
jgi:hypothetical protein